MDRDRMKDFYCFIRDAANRYYSASYSNIGEIVISTSSFPNMTPIEMNPANLKTMEFAFGTNKTYFSGARSMVINWEMIGDGADIVRSIKYNGRGYAGELYFLILRYNPYDGIYYKYYEGRFDLAQCKDKNVSISCPCIDSSCWGILSQNDTVQYSIDCTPQSPTAVPVLFDGINLKSRYTWQTVNSSFKLHNDEGVLFDHPIDLVQVNSDGDSVGIITKNEHYVPADSPRYTTDNYIYRPTKPNTIHLFGQFNYQAQTERPGEIEITLWIHTNLKLIKIASNYFHINDSYIYQYMSFDVNIDLAAGEWVEFFLGGTKSTNAAGLHDWVILPDVCNIYIETLTRSDASIVWCRRPLDVAQEIVANGTNNKYTVNSDFFTKNNKIVLTTGNALRGSANAQIKSSFQNWFKAYDIEYWLAFKIVKNQMWIEPVPVIYDGSTNLFEIGEVKDYDIEDAYDYLLNEIELNMNKQDYRHTSGRLEFNGLNTFSVYQYNVKNKLSLVSPYRKDCYGMEFIRYDYQQQSTQDNIGDDAVFMVDITDEKGSAGKDVFNFTDITVNNQPLAPIIYFPRQNDVIANNKPTISGVCQPDTQVFIYADGVVDGSTSSDGNGNWSYNIQTPLDYFEQDVNTGVHLLEATFTDLTGTQSAVTITCVDEIQASGFENIHSNDNLYDNKPLIRGYLESGITLPLFLDGVMLLNVTGDGNGRWAVKSPVLLNGRHVLKLDSATVIFNVFSFVELPIITSFQEGLQIVDNIPLVEGVAKPGTKVDLYLDYYPNVSLGTTFADTNGNWSIQLVPMEKDDGTPLIPIPNGNHVISTSLDIDSVSISIEGYLLNRPNYSNIQGVLDDSVYNTQLTPKHNLIKRMVFWKSVFAQQPDTIIKFETGDKNVAFSTTLDGVTTKENDDLLISQYSDQPLFLPYIFNCTVETPFFFADVVDNFNNGGLVKLTYQGNELYCLPIGKMSVNDVTRDVQKWSLLISAKTPLSTLLKLSTPGLILNTMSNTVFRSDYNTLHFVKYNFDASVDYDKQPELYEDWFANRNDPWVNNPEYFQKVQTTDVIVDQIIINGLGGTITMKMYDCENGKLIQTYNYSAVTPAPIPAPDIVLQTTISNLPEGEYFFCMFVGTTPFAISERISVATRHYGTILIDAAGTRNKTGAIFSNGWRSKFRVEGLVEKYVGSMENIINEDEMGDYDMLRAVTTRKRTIVFGTGKGIPDYLYLKIVSAITLDDLLIQGVGYTIDKNASIEPPNKISGYPMYYYQVDFDLKDNVYGYTFDNVVGRDIRSVVLSVDNGAFGFANGGFSDITLTNTPVIPIAKINSWSVGVSVTANQSLTANIYLPQSLQINWGDGQITTVTDRNSKTVAHTYASAGNYNISFSGVVEGGGYVHLDSFGTALKSTTVIDAEFNDFSLMFSNSGITSIPAGLLDKCPNVTTLYNLFSHSQSLAGNIPNDLLRYCTKVTTVSAMFWDCPNLTGAVPNDFFKYNPLITTVQSVFYGTKVTSFPADLFRYNTELSTFAYCFYTCSELTGTIPADLFKYNTKATNLQGVFLGCAKLTGSIPEGLFDSCVNATNISTFFQGCTGLTGSIPNSMFKNNTKVTTFLSTFNACSGLTGTIGTNLFKNCPLVTTFATCFNGCTNLTGSIPFALFQYNNVVNSFSGTFQNCSKLTGAIPVDLFNTTFLSSNVSVVFSNAFNACSGLTNIPIGLFDNVPNMGAINSLFLNCSGLTGSIPDGLFSKTKITGSCSSAFQNCTGLTGKIPDYLFANQPLINSFSNTFNNCPNLTSLGVGLFYGNTENTTNSNLFATCTNLAGPIPDDLFVGQSKCTTWINAFLNCSKLTAFGNNMFGGCSGTTSFNTCFNGCSGITSPIPADLFKDCIGATGFSSTFYLCSGLTGSIPAGLFKGKLNVTTFQSCFQSSGVTGSIPVDLFQGCTKVTNMIQVFYNSKVNGVIPAGLFNDCTEVTSFATCFRQTQITGIGAGLFDKCTKATDCSSVFYTITTLNSIPDYLFKNQNLVTTFANCFYLNTGVTHAMPQNLFSPTLPNGVTFQNALRMANITGSAPALWTQYPTAVGTACFNGDTKLSNYASIPAGWK